MPIGPDNKNRFKLGEILLSQNHINSQQLEVALAEQSRTGESLGAVLISHGFIDEEILSAVLGKQIEITQRKRIGEMLVDQGYITEQQLHKALEAQKTMNKKLGKCLVSLGFLDESKLLDVLAAQLDFQHVRLDNFNFDDKVISIIPEEMARTYKAIPLYITNKTLTIAITDPTNLRTLDHIKFKTSMKVEPVIATEAEIMAAIEKNYSKESEALANLLGKDSDADLEVVEQHEDEDVLVDSEGQQVVKIVNLLVTEAIQEGASDIHLEPQENYMKLRYRIDGDLVEKNPIPRNFMAQVSSRLKILSGMDIAERRKPLDGRFTIRHKGKEVDLRVSTFPVALRGLGVREKIVIRILNFDTSRIDLKRIGFSKSTYEKFSDVIQLPNGIVLVTGPTGSGKSSTLYACIKHVQTPEVNIVTMEDPVEMNLEGVNQGQINVKAGFTFAAGMRSILRQDPDIIMLGEMRDFETAQMAVQAALTGHLVYSTLHTNDSAEAFTRLTDMGIEPFLLNACVRGILAQRLVRGLCKKCKEEYIPEDDLLVSIGIRPGTTFYRGKGCPSCNNTGYAGRLGVFELLVPDFKIHEMVYKRSPSEEIKSYAVRNLGMTTLRRDGLEKALAGLTTIEQVLSVSAA